MCPSEILERHREDIRRIVSRYHGANPRVFGSVARGEARDNSDIDILIDPMPGMTLMDQGAIAALLEDVLQAHVDVVISDTPPPGRLRRILQESKPI